MRCCCFSYAGIAASARSRPSPGGDRSRTTSMWAVGTVGGTGAIGERSWMTDAAPPWSPRRQGWSWAVAGPKHGLPLQAGAPKQGWGTDTGGSCLLALGAFHTGHAHQDRCVATPGWFGSQTPPAARVRQCRWQHIAGPGMLAALLSRLGASQPLLLARAGSPRLQWGAAPHSPPGGCHSPASTKAAAGTARGEKCCLRCRR